MRKKGLHLVLPAAAYDRERARSDRHFLAGLAAAKRGEFAEAYQSFLKSHRSGNSDATYSMGFWQTERLVNGANDAKAAKFYRAAASRNHRTATFEVASAYSDRRGVRQSKRIAMRWYLKAAKLGVTEAMFNFAIFHLHLGGEKRVAKHWLSKAAARGDREARAVLKKLAKGIEIGLNGEPS